MENNKNKIDAVIDEVLESKRLNQGVQVVKKGVGISIIIGLVLFVIFLVGIALGIVK